ncbi:MAG: integrase [Candidatus Parabeggiatoa sp. nov. 1]|nr:MAG: integrase [Gammaproteobacteria bacterium]
MNELATLKSALNSDKYKDLELSVKVKDYLSQAMAENTKLSYQDALAKFYKEGYKIPATPVQIAEYISHVKIKNGETPSMATLKVWLAALGMAHKSLGFANPCDSTLVSQTFRGMKRTHGTAQRQARPLLFDDITKMTQADLFGGYQKVKEIRDMALILVGFSGMFRRAELVGLLLSDLTETTEGFVVWQRRSKTDQMGQGRKVGIPRAAQSSEEDSEEENVEAVCPVKALAAWVTTLKQQQITTGPVFRHVDKGGAIGENLHARSVSRILKYHAEKAGIDPTLVSGHSLRAGAATELAIRGVDLWKVQQQGGWKNTRTLVERYIRGARIFADNAMAEIW